MRGRDRAFVAELAADAFGEYAPDAARVVLDFVARPSAISRIAVAEQIAVGFAVVNPVPIASVAWLNAIAVARAQRGRGVGRQLLADVERAAAARGIAELWLNTAQGNLAALDLFLKCGYAIHGRHPRFYARGQGAVEMRKRLAPTKG